MAKIDEMEHHAFLLSDELDLLSDIFRLGVKYVIVDLRGRTSRKRKTTINERLGIYSIIHEFRKVYVNDLRLNNQGELNKISEHYSEEGVKNLYIKRLKICWQPGDEHEWKGKKVQTLIPDIQRTSNSIRWNVLTIKAGLKTEVDKYVKRYGAHIVKGTICINEKKPKEGLTCQGSLANEVNTEHAE